MNYFAFGLTIATDLDFENELSKSILPPDLSIFEGMVESSSKMTPTKVFRNNERLWFYEKNHNQATLFWPNIGYFLIENGSTITYQRLGDSLGTLKLFVLSEVIGFALKQRNIYLLHGSAVQINNEAHVFVGVPGAGKSTTATAFWKKGYSILSDDMVLITNVNQFTFVIPSFSQFKIWNKTIEGLKLDSNNLSPSFEGGDKYLLQQDVETFPKELIKLKSINILLKHNSSKKDGEIKSIFAPTELIKHYPLPYELLKGDNLKNHFSQSMKIASTTKVYQKKRPKDFNALNTYIDNFIYNNTNV
ncbi:MAG: serine kinase [Pseudarcicella sp.]|nr:serine kinase [Pseudarcicella sp.]